jgi:hypothetical protein
VLVERTQQQALLERELLLGRHMLKPAAATHAEMRTHGIDPCARGFEHFHELRPVSLSPASARSEDDTFAGERPLDEHRPAVDVDDSAPGSVQ